MSIFLHTSICWQPVYFLLHCRRPQGQLDADSCGLLPPLVAAIAEKSIELSTPLPEVSVFIAGQPYSTSVTLVHGITLPDCQSQHTAACSFNSLNQGQGRRRKRSKRKWQQWHGTFGRDPDQKVTGRWSVTAALSKREGLRLKAYPPIQGFWVKAPNLWLMHTQIWGTLKMLSTSNRRENCPSGVLNWSWHRVTVLAEQQHFNLALNLT